MNGYVPAPSPFPSVLVYMMFAIAVDEVVCSPRSAIAVVEVDGFMVWSAVNVLAELRDGTPLTVPLKLIAAPALPIVITSADRVA